MKCENYTILIVEDSITQAAFLQTILEMENYKVMVANNGEEALEMIKTKKPHIVLSDVIMPLMDGFTLCKRIKNDKLISDIPVVLLTTLTDPRDIIKGLESGADKFIPKPYKEEYLLSQVESVLINMALSENNKVGFGMDIFFNGEKYFITSEKRQIVSLLLSTYEQAVNKSNELSKAHSDLSRLNEDLGRKKKELEKVNQEMNYFMGIAAHDLKNPLNGIIGFTGLLMDSLDPESDPDNFHFLEIIRESGNKMLTIITDLLDISKLEAGKLIAKKEWMNITELLKANIETNQYLASKKDIVINFIQQNETTFCFADESKMDQVMNNLLTNAIKFSFPGTTIKVILAKYEKSVSITVEDQGQGIPQKELQELFKPFVQTSVKPTHGEGSTGLGLYSVKRIIDAHEGEITVSSVVGQGTTFCITLPD